jgi:carbohydrate-binding DOMON domain-containing protein
MPRRVLLALLVAAAPAAARGGARLVAAFDDDANDATGPGSYRKPGDSDLVGGDFDLRRFEVWRDGDDVLFKVTMAAPFRRPDITARTFKTPVELWNGISYQNIDIYIDSGGGAPGFTVCIPGRRVAFAGGRTWKIAVVLTPQPGPAENITRDALGEAGAHVLFPRNLQTSGRTVIARVPAAALGGPPQRSWAYSVHISGARWERSYTVVDRLVSGTPEPDAFTMPVLGMPEAWAFGGAPEGSAHPRVVDVLLPPGSDQKAVLGSFDARSGAFARVPFVSLEAEAAPPPPPPPSPTWAVVDVADRTVTIAGPTAGLAPLRLGRVLDASGQAVGRVVIVRVLEGGLACDVVDGEVQRGAAVTFSP